MERRPLVDVAKDEPARTAFTIAAHAAACDGMDVSRAYPARDERGRRSVVLTGAIHEGPSAGGRLVMFDAPRSRARCAHVKSEYVGRARLADERPSMPEDRATVEDGGQADDDEQDDDGCGGAREPRDRT